jgi:hypothetical protein
MCRISCPEGAPVLPAQGVALRTVAYVLECAGPTGQRFPTGFGERLALRADTNMMFGHVPQGVALGWENTGPSAR